MSKKSVGFQYPKRGLAGSINRDYLANAEQWLITNDKVTPEMTEAARALHEAQENLPEPLTVQQVAERVRQGKAQDADVLASFAYMVASAKSGSGFDASVNVRNQILGVFRGAVARALEAAVAEHREEMARDAEQALTDALRALSEAAEDVSLADLTAPSGPGALRRSATFQEALQAAKAAARTAAFFRIYVHPPLKDTPELAWQKRGWSIVKPDEEQPVEAQSEIA